MKALLVPLAMAIILTAALYGCKTTTTLDSGTWDHGYLPPLTQIDPDVWAHIEGEEI
jgi:hypothetical protein